ncbi:MAG: acetolactate synthase small subunit [Candidatus Marinimicrobia bacterium]|nr:acetolactate synthase small subunit [Candidatus Neomarinimicrobiota bacterium]
MKQILIALVEDKPGVLNRIASLFRRRNFNIESLVVGHSEVPGASRLTIVTDEEERLRRNIIRQNLLKLVNVIDVTDVTDLPCILREHALIKVQSAGATRGEIAALVDMYRGRIVDVGMESLVVEITGEPTKIESLIDVLATYGIIEIVRAGKVAITRGPQNPTDNGNLHLWKSSRGKASQDKARWKGMTV